MSDEEYVPFVFSHESLAYWDELEKKTWERVRELVKEHVVKDHRAVITSKDIAACIPQAIREIAIEVGIEAERKEKADE